MMIVKTASYIPFLKPARAQRPTTVMMITKTVVVASRATAPFLGSG